ncbi:MAG: hypothetical protein H7287_02250 [Thermoleophilia bacterium]|nr:hypothetical protein [Thermoleophilia bacterium]
MTSFAPLAARDVRGMICGGREAMTALTARVGAADSNMLFELFQLNDAELLTAMRSATRAGRRLDVLADARLSVGGAQAAIDGAVGASAGQLRTYGEAHLTHSGEEYFQHGKSYHFAGPRGPEAWLTNLAPIPDTANRTEISMVLGGDAAAAAQLVTRDAVNGGLRRGAASIDAAAGVGVLVNDPLRDRRVLSEGVFELLHDQPAARDLLVITKGLEDPASTSAIIDAHRAGRDVRVLVRDIAAADAQRLAGAQVPAWVVSGGLKPRINAIFAGERGIVGTAFLWRNMVGSAAEATSRDVGVLLDGAAGASARSAALTAARSGQVHTPIGEAVARGHLPEHI